MATGALDANGIWQYGEDDSEATFSGLLNKLASSTSDTVTRLEGFTGFTGTVPTTNLPTIPVSKGGTGATTASAAREALRVGLVPMVPSSVAIATGSGSANAVGRVAFSGASAVSLNGVFTSEFENYRIIFRVDSGGSTGQAVNARLRASGTDNSSASYTRNGAFNALGSGIDQSNTSGGTSWTTIWLEGSNTAVWLDLNRPQVNSLTSGTYVSRSYTSAAAYFSQVLVHGTTASYDGITFFTTGGTMTGVVTVYGYTD